MNETEKQHAIEVLNKILELELAGVVRYTHYALMVFGYNRIPIVSWLQGNGDESLAHARPPAPLRAAIRRHAIQLGVAVALRDEHDARAVR